MRLVSDGNENAAILVTRWLGDTVSRTNTFIDLSALSTLEFLTSLADRVIFKWTIGESNSPQSIQMAMWLYVDTQRFGEFLVRSGKLGSARLAGEPLGLVTGPGSSIRAAALSISFADSVRSKGVVCGYISGYIFFIDIFISFITIRYATNAIPPLAPRIHRREGRVACSELASILTGHPA